MQRNDLTWETKLKQFLQRTGVLLQFGGLMVLLGVLWPCCHIHRLAIPAFGMLNTRARQVHDRLRSLNAKTRPER